MSYEYIVLAQNPAAYFPQEEDEVSLYESVIQVSEGVLNIIHIEDPTLPGDTLVATTGSDGVPLPGYNYEEYMKLVPHGNREDGKATGLEQFQHTWAGWHPHHRMFGEPTALEDVVRIYPAEVRPYHAQIRHKYFNTPETPASTGWGFRVELAGKGYPRQPSARAIGSYTDPECTIFEWTTGAFQLGPSEWQAGEDGEPLEVWFTDSWDGARMEEKKDWHIAFLLGSAQEGHQTLPITANEKGVEYLFWEYNHGGGGGEVQPWVQPDGAGGPNFPYQIGDLVTHTGSTWESTHNDNVWEPGVFGWTVVAEGRGRGRKKRA